MQFCNERGPIRGEASKTRANLRPSSESIVFIHQKIKRPGPDADSVVLIHDTSIERRESEYTVLCAPRITNTQIMCARPPSVNVRQPRPERARNRQNLPTSVGRRHQFDVHFFSLYPTTTPKSTYLRKVALTFSVQPTLRPFLPFPGEKQDPK